MYREQERLFIQKERDTDISTYLKSEVYKYTGVTLMEYMNFNNVSKTILLHNVNEYIQNRNTALEDDLEGLDG